MGPFRLKESNYYKIEMEICKNKAAAENGKPNFINWVYR